MRKACQDQPHSQQVSKPLDAAEGAPQTIEPQKASIVESDRHLLNHEAEDRIKQGL
jgi:hypothetical protein